jgi:hypothetical protein
MNNVNIHDVIKLVQREADNCEEAAAYGGERGDRGAGIIRQQVYFYKLGLANELPKEWEKHAKKLDPEYNEYLRLKEKFKGVDR